ncbi:50S ribosomal protein L13 [Candidatus Woesearchaeota archaeon]|nr:50S ribosomal protein L13 [Candidatus Woesearchaeota archaeon]
MNMIIDAKDTVLGRLATFAAKKALLGESVDVINSEKAVIIGRKEVILAKYKQRRARGGPHTGPYILRSPERLVKRTIRGMLPHKQEKGELALKKVRCYNGIPQSCVGKEAVTLENAKLCDRHMRYITVKQLALELGHKDA